MYKCKLNVNIPILNLSFDLCVALETLATRCPHLDTLDVGWCEAITGGGAHHLATRCPTLRYLGLVRCDLVTIEVSEDLCRRYPHVHFSTMWLDLKRTLQKAREQGFVTPDFPELDLPAEAEAADPKQ